jgi:hypothetical protein
MNLQEFIYEADNFEYSAEAMDILKTTMECTLIEAHLESMEFCEDNTELVSMMESTYFGEAKNKDKDKKEGLMASLNSKRKSLWDKIVAILSRIKNAIVSFFKSIWEKIKKVGAWLKNLPSTRIKKFDEADANMVIKAYKNAIKKSKLPVAENYRDKVIRAIGSRTVVSGAHPIWQRLTKLVLEDPVLISVTAGSKLSHACSPKDLTDITKDMAGKLVKMKISKVISSNPESLFNSLNTNLTKKLEKNRAKGFYLVMDEDFDKVAGMVDRLLTDAMDAIKSIKLTPTRGAKGLNKRLDMERDKLNNSDSAAKNLAGMALSGLSVNKEGVGQAMEFLKNVQKVVAQTITISAMYVSYQNTFTSSMDAFLQNKVDNMPTDDDDQNE